MRLLLTRPELDGARTATELRALGHEVTLAPLLRVETVPNADLGAGPWDAILLTSANAARALATHARRPELQSLPVLAVGQGSAAAARATGFADVTSADGDGGDLARLAASRWAGSTVSLLYPAGEKRARELGSELAAHGHKVDTVVVYRTIQATTLPPNAERELRAGAIDGVMHYSRRSAEAYLNCTRELAAMAVAPAHYCISERTAELVRDAGAATIYVARRPDEAGMLALVAPRE